MSFFSDLFNKKEGGTVVLIDISANSIAGAYVRFTKDALPVLLYTHRIPIEVMEIEIEGRAMLRALKILGDTLIRDGAPMLVRTVGSASVNNILVSIDAPWQKISVRTEYFEQNMPFIFNKSLVLAAMEKSSVVPKDHMLADESVIGTILNGYETSDPYGKQAHRASIVILTSLIDEEIAKGVNTILRSMYHTRNIVSIAGGSLHYQAMRIVFPHERDALILDATGPLTSVLLVRRDLLTKVIEISTRTNNSATWLKEITDAFATLAGKFPLPRTIFLLAHEWDTARLRKALDKAGLGKFWLSDNPPNIVSVLGSHISLFVRQTATEPSDLSLLLMALYYQHHKA
ncbi:MAG: hypothetical protein Q8L52_00175 [bacterium]|nr:hypothetical protein [bacterium]